MVEAGGINDPVFVVRCGSWQVDTACDYGTERTASLGFWLPGGCGFGGSQVGLIGFLGEGLLSSQFNPSTSETLVFHGEPGFGR